MKRAAIAVILAGVLGGCGTSIRGHNYCPQIWIPEAPVVQDYSVTPITYEGKKGFFLDTRSVEVLVRGIKDWQYIFRQLSKSVETYNKWADRQIQESTDE